MSNQGHGVEEDEREEGAFESCGVALSVQKGRGLLHDDITVILLIKFLVLICTHLALSCACYP